MESNWRDTVAQDGLSGWIVGKAARWLAGGFTHVLELYLPNRVVARCIVNYTPAGLQTLQAFAPGFTDPFPGPWAADVEPD